MKKIALLILSSCVLIKCTSTKKAEYDFPAQMLPHVKVAYTDQCDKGQALYKTNCAKCHSYKVKGKTYIPDFKPEQLVGYTLRITNPRHEASLTDTLITTEELGLIMTFLSYKKKNPVNSGTSK